MLSLVPKLVAATPFALATLALLYDVGWFSRIGSDFFSLFSLTEHLGFGMEGIPYLLLGLMLLYFIVAGSILASHRLDATARDKSAAFARHFTEIFFIGGGVIYFLVYPDLWPAGVLFIFVGLMYVAAHMTEGSPGRVTILLVGGFVTVLLSAFAQGWAIGAVVLNPKDAGPLWPKTPSSTILLVDGPSISGRVLRSGERGLLVFDDVERSILFKRWEEVRAIDLSKAVAP